MNTDPPQAGFARSCRAGYRQRSVARGNIAIGNVLRAHDSGNSPEANADGSLRPIPDGRASVLPISSRDTFAVHYAASDVDEKAALL